MSICNICDWKGNSFSPAGKPKRDGSKCPSCFSKERHRLFGYFSDNLYKFDFEIRNVLHIAPEKSIEAILKNKFPRAEYIRADINSDLDVDVVADLTDLPFDTDLFDIIYCSHVLEHIPEDRIAISEIGRVLSSHGTGFIQVPLFPVLNTIDGRNFDPYVRKLVLGQEDHVWGYGHDFVRRFQSPDFTLAEHRIYEEICPTTMHKYGLIHDTSHSPVEGRNQEVIFTLECKQNG